MINIYINGLSGKMGTSLKGIVDKNKDFKLVPQFNINNFIDVVIDFSRPESSIGVLKECSKNKIPFITGTTGFTENDQEMIKKFSKNIPVLISSNFSLGIFQLKKSIINFLKKNKKKITCRIDDIHHKQKVDSPSGTAMDLKKIVEKFDKNNIVDSICINSQRIGNHFGIHAVTFFNENESIKFSHEALSREIFSQTALDVSKELINKDSGLYILEDFIFLK